MTGNIRVFDLGSLPLLNGPKRYLVFPLDEIVVIKGMPHFLAFWNSSVSYHMTGNIRVFDLGSLPLLNGPKLYLVFRKVEIVVIKGTPHFSAFWTSSVSHHMTGNIRFSTWDLYPFWMVQNVI
jgi:uncharacterized membrane protein YoaT (DUF817 family)